MNMVLRYPGAKWRIADWIIEHMPKHHSYLEPFFGSGAVLFSKQPSRIETVNDLDDDVINLFEIIWERAQELAYYIDNTPYARMEYDKAFTYSNDAIHKAMRFLIRCWQGYGFRTNDYKVGWKRDVCGREASYAVRNWNRLPGWIIEVQSRLLPAVWDWRPLWLF